jgi:hypothetical protein
VKNPSFGRSQGTPYQIDTKLRRPIPDWFGQSQGNKYPGFSNVENGVESEFEMRGKKRYNFGCEPPAHRNPNKDDVSDDNQRKKPDFTRGVFACRDEDQIGRKVTR